MEEREKAKVMFKPAGIWGEVKKGTSVLEASRLLGVDIESLCGGNRKCGKCLIQIIEGTFPDHKGLSRQTHAEPWQEVEQNFITGSQKKAGFRLACCARIKDDLLVFVPEKSRTGKQWIRKDARDIPIHWNPAIKTCSVRITEPSFDDPSADLDRIITALHRDYGLSDLNIDYHALRQLSDCVRKEKWQITVAVWMDREIVRIFPGHQKDAYGVAVDIGTTTVAAYICNLATMEVVDTQTTMNPQCRYGEDVMSRISYIKKNEGGLDRMRDDIVKTINTLIQNFSAMSDSPTLKGPKKEYPRISPEDIMDMTIVGNTVMHHILLGLNPIYLSLPPFPPVIHRSIDIKARDMGIDICPSAYVHVLPNEAGFVGADNVGVILAEEPHKKEEIELIIDLGTNGELVLGNKKGLASASCATGPALEGSQISCGMRAAPGAIEQIRINPQTHEVDYKVIGRDAWKNYSKPHEMKTMGICGSGILEVLGELYRSGIIMKNGHFNPRQKSKRYRKNNETGKREFVIAWAEETGINRDLAITQKDIRQIQLAKAAVYSGCKLMMKYLGVDKVDRIKIAGPFVTHLDRENALIIGLIPDCELDRIIAIGNAAGDGARAALLDREKRSEANWVSRNVQYIELAADKRFQHEFVQAMHIPHMSDSFPPLESLLPEKKGTRPSTMQIKEEPYEHAPKQRKNESTGH